jgi:hypothetical protein
VDLFKNALKAFPNSSHTYQAWACLEKDRGNWETAFKVTLICLSQRRGQSLNPSFCWQLFRMGIEIRPWDGGAYQPFALALKERGEVSPF